MENVISLKGVTLDVCSGCYCLICPYIPHTDIRDLSDSELTVPKIKTFVIQILKVFIFL